MSLLHGVKNIIFDFGGVLIDLDYEASMQAFEKLGVSQIREIANPYAQKGILMELEEGLISPETFFDNIRQTTGKEISDQQIIDAWTAFLLDVPPSKIEMLKILKQKGYRQFMLSNTNEIHAPNFLKKYFQTDGYSPNEYFDKYYLSCRIKISKPKKEIFKYVIDDAKIDPTQTLFVDDGPQNIAMAASLGFKTYQPQPFEDFTSLFL